MISPTITPRLTRRQYRDLLIHVAKTDSPFAPWRVTVAQIRIETGRPVSDRLTAYIIAELRERMASMFIAGTR